MCVLIFTAHSNGTASIESHGRTENSGPGSPGIWLQTETSLPKRTGILLRMIRTGCTGRGEAGSLFFISSLLFPGSVLEFREAENNSTNLTLGKGRAQEKQSYVSLKRVNISFLTV